jgi:hypothetical protein
MWAFRDEVAEPLEEVASAWRAGWERSAVADDADDFEALAQTFHRVRDDWELSSNLLAREDQPRSDAMSPARTSNDLELAEGFEPPTL